MSGKELSDIAEEYLEAIYKLSKDGRNRVSTSAIARNMNITPSTVSKMLKKLDEKGYVDYSPYRGVSLTVKGIRDAKKITRKHRLLERFLHDILKLGKDKVHDQACKMEHHLSDDAERALCQFLRYPDKCPDDSQTIPACDLEFSNCEECMERVDIDEVGKRKTTSFSLIDLREGEVGRVIFIRGGRKVIRRLLDMGITPNTVIKVIRIAPFGGPVEISVRESNIALGRSIASKIFVELIEK